MSALRPRLFPGVLSQTASVGLGDIALPAFGPIAPERPAPDGLGGTQIALASLSYAENTRPRSAEAFAAFESSGLTPDAVVESWKRMNPVVCRHSVAEPYIAAGSFTTEGDAQRLAQTLAAFGQTEIEKSDIDGTVWYGVNLRTDGRRSLDDLLQAAWDSGATDAMTVRD